MNTHAVAVVAISMLVVFSVACSDETGGTPPPSGTVFGRYSLTAPAWPDVEYRFLADGTQRRTDFVQATGAFSIFETAESYNVLCIWRDGSFPSGSADCSKNDKPASVPGVLTPLDSPSWLIEDLPVAGTSVAPRTILGRELACYRRTVDNDLLDESCFTSEGWLAYHIESTPMGDSIMEAIELNGTLPDDAFVIPDDVDDLTGQPF